MVAHASNLSSGEAEAKEGIQTKEEPGFNRLSQNKTDKQRAIWEKSNHIGMYYHSEIAQDFNQSWGYL